MTETHCLHGEINETKLCLSMEFVTKVTARPTGYHAWMYSLILKTVIVLSV